jgi:hypothetical protein
MSVDLQEINVDSCQTKIHKIQAEATVSRHADQDGKHKKKSEATDFSIFFFDLRDILLIDLTENKFVFIDCS